MCGFIAQLVEQRTGNAEVTGSNPVEPLIFFRLLLSNCLNWNIYCDDHSSLSSRTAVQKWIISYIVHIRQDVSKNSNEMTKWPFESGDFDENGEIGVNDEYGEHSPKSNEMTIGLHRV